MPSFFSHTKRCSFPTEGAAECPLLSQYVLWKTDAFLLILYNLCNIMAEDLACCVFGSYFFHSAIHPFAYNCCLRSQSGFAKFRIYAVLLHQFLMCTFFCNSIFGQHQDLLALRIVERRWAITKVVRSLARRSRDCCTTFSLSLSRRMLPHQRSGSADSSEKLSQWKDAVSVLRKASRHAVQCLCHSYPAFP